MTDDARTNFEGRPIRKETIALGIGGQIERFAELPPRAEVIFEARAIVDSVKFKYTENGMVDEITSLTVQNDSFKVKKVIEHEPPPQLPGTEEGGATVTETPTAPEGH